MIELWYDSIWILDDLIPRTNTFYFSMDANKKNQTAKLKTRGNQLLNNSKKINGKSNGQVSICWPIARWGLWLAE